MEIAASTSQRYVTVMNGIEPVRKKDERERWSRGLGGQALVRLGPRPFLGFAAG